MVLQIKNALRDASFQIGERVIPKRIRYSGVLGYARRQMIFWARDVFVLSYPKCGRTWLRTMIGHVLDAKYNLNLSNPMEIQHFWKLSSNVPCIDFAHDDSPNLKTPSEINQDKSRFRRKKILFLARDPRDVVVSYYFDASLRMKVFQGSLSDFVRQDVGSIDSIITYYNSWARGRHQVKAFRLQTYEDMHSDPHSSLRDALEFLDVADVSDELIDNAVSFGSFNNLRKIEQRDAFGHERMRAADQSNPESFKVRRGRTGGFVDYLSPEEIRMIDDRIESSLDPMFKMYRRRS
jgi:hypothetical protein